MKSKKSFLSVSTSLIIIFLLSACETVRDVTNNLDNPDGYARNIRNIFLPAKHRKSIEVICVDFEDMLQYVYQAAMETFPECQIDFLNDRSGVFAEDSSNKRYIMSPKMILDKSTDAPQGVLLDVLTVYSSGMSSRGYFSQRSSFEDALLNLLPFDTETETVTGYRVSSDAGTPERMPFDAPLDYSSFKNYIDHANGLAPFEGIWADDNGIYTLALIRDPNRVRYSYVAYVLSSRRSNWKPGEVKAYFTDISLRNPTTGLYRMGTKGSVGSTWAAQSSTLIVGKTSIQGMEIALIKEYPKSTNNELLRGAGTAWSVQGGEYFVTNHHVVEGASKIWLGGKGVEKVEAKVMATDEKLDLALLRVAKPIEMRDLPISEFMEDKGASIVVLGFPYTFDLGADLKITDGIISSTFGVNDDPTQYQISAPIQPGNSGGPVLNEKGEVVGVAVSGLNGRNPSFQDKELINYAVKVQYLKPLLSTAKISISAPVKNTDKVKQYDPEDLMKLYGESVIPIWTE